MAVTKGGGGVVHMNEAKKGMGEGTAGDWGEGGGISPPPPPTTTFPPPPPERFSFYNIN